MLMHGFFPGPLLRSLQRFDQLGEVDNGNRVTHPRVLARGTLLGTHRGITSTGNDASILQQVAVWGLLHPSPEGAKDHSFERNLPGGISSIGSFVIVRGEAFEDENQLESAALQATREAKAETIVLVYEVLAQALRMFRCNESNATAIPMQVVQCLHARDFHRVIGFAPLRCAVDLHVVGDKRALLRQVEKYVAATRADRDLYVRVSCTHGKKGRRDRVLIGRGEDVTSWEATPVVLTSILPERDDPNDVRGGTKKKKHDKKQKNGSRMAPSQRKRPEDHVSFFPTLEYGNIATIDLLLSLSPSNSDVTAPVVTIPTPSTSTSRYKHYHAHCEAFVLVPVDSTVHSALELLRQQLYAQFTDVANRLRDALKDVISITTHQFPLIGAAFPLTLQSTSPSDESQFDFKTLHRAFLQPFPQPLFRVSQGCSLAQQGAWLFASEVLVNVHEGIPSAGFVGAQCQSALVDGFYGYYHYLQQGTNDKGWGCAYRSLQTLASWLFLQHYTNQSFLSHEQIQRVLVQLGDKPARFQGSNEWIGSLEVGYVLDELFGVPFRSLSVSSGTRLPEVARELLEHFETQGTPVMMGGGQLAFTILGVSYSPETGVCAFLTLDPHYTGDEDLATIQHEAVALEGYKAVPCSWRQTTSFAPRSFYNLCLPQRPRVEM